ncbi:hypothetical protein JCGZ_05494 [Jatropha curcas]|uniref:Zinc finger GRF-type domain-containing protein n=1 Tax=Jatropha curcas TaxID=180498 RepID=A0A067L6H4_JATCU|nr:hypothetical protein JCGZ_05494 [Jatropha curcas]
MSSSSAADGAWEGRYVNMYCKCGKKAGIRISETQKNKNRLYYYYIENACGSFLGWCKAIDSSDRSQGSEFEVRQKSVATDLFEFKEEMLYMKREMMKMYNEIVTIGGKRECLESEIGSLKKLIFICLIAIMMLFTLLVMLLFKGNRGL